MFLHIYIMFLNIELNFVLLNKIIKTQSSQSKAQEHLQKFKYIQYLTK